MYINKSTILLTPAALSSCGPSEWHPAAHPHSPRSPERKERLSVDVFGVSNAQIESFSHEEERTPLRWR